MFSCAIYQIIFVVDEHSVFGSLCSCVSEVLATNNINIKQVNIAIQDSYEVSGPYEPLKDSLGISASKITKKILINSLTTRQYIRNNSLQKY